MLSQLSSLTWASQVRRTEFWMGQPFVESVRIRAPNRRRLGRALRRPKRGRRSLGGLLGVWVATRVRGSLAAAFVATTIVDARPDATVSAVVPATRVIEMWVAHSVAPAIQRISTMFSTVEYGDAGLWLEIFVDHLVLGWRAWRTLALGLYAL